MINFFLFVLKKFFNIKNFLFLQLVFIFLFIFAVFVRAEDSDNASLAEKCEEYLKEDNIGKQLECLGSYSNRNADDNKDQYYDNNGEYRIGFFCKDDDTSSTRGAYWYIVRKCLNEGGGATNYKVGNSLQLGNQGRCEGGYDTTMFDFEIMVCNQYHNFWRVLMGDTCGTCVYGPAGIKYCGKTICKKMRPFKGERQFNNMFSFRPEMVRVYSTIDGKVVRFIREKDRENYDRTAFNIYNIGLSEVELSAILSNEGNDLQDAIDGVMGIWENKYDIEEAYLENDIVPLSYDEENDIFIITDKSSQEYRVIDQFRLCIRRSKRDIAGVFKAIGLAVAAPFAPMLLGVGAVTLPGLLVGGVLSGVIASELSSEDEFFGCNTKYDPEALDAEMQKNGVQPCYDEQEGFLAGMAQFHQWFVIPYKQFAKGVIYDGRKGDDIDETMQRSTETSLEGSYYANPNINQIKQAQRGIREFESRISQLSGAELSSLSSLRDEIEHLQKEREDSKTKIDILTNYCIPIPLGPDPISFPKMTYFDDSAFVPKEPEIVVCEIASNANSTINYNEKVEVGTSGQIVRKHRRECTDNTVAPYVNGRYSNFETPRMIVRVGFDETERSIIPIGNNVSPVYDTDLFSVTNEENKVSQTVVMFEGEEIKEIKLYSENPDESGKLINGGQPVYKYRIGTKILPKQAEYCAYLVDNNNEYQSLIKCVPHNDPKPQQITLQAHNNILDPLVSIIIWKENAIPPHPYTTVPNENNAIQFNNVTRNELRSENKRCPVGFSCDCADQYKCTMKPGDQAMIAGRKIWTHNFSETESATVVSFFESKKFVEALSGDFTLASSEQAYDDIIYEIKLGRYNANKHFLTYVRAQFPEPITDQPQHIQDLFNAIEERYEFERMYINVYGLIGSINLYQKGDGANFGSGTSKQALEPYSIVGVNSLSGYAPNLNPSFSFDGRLAVVMRELVEMEMEYVGAGNCYIRKESEKLISINAWETNTVSVNSNKTIRVDVLLPESQNLPKNDNILGYDDNDNDNGIKRDYYVFMRHYQAPRCPARGGDLWNYYVTKDYYASVNAVEFSANGDISDIESATRNNYDSETIKDSFNFNEKHVKFCYSAAEIALGACPANVFQDNNLSWNLCFRHVYDMIKNHDPYGHQFFAVSGYNFHANSVIGCSKFADVMINLGDGDRAGNLGSGSNEYFYYSFLTGRFPTTVEDEDAGFHKVIKYGSRYYHTLGWGAIAAGFDDSNYGLGEEVQLKGINVPNIGSLCSYEDVNNDLYTNSGGKYTNNCSCWKYGGLGLLYALGNELPTNIVQDFGYSNFTIPGKPKAEVMYDFLDSDGQVKPIPTKFADMMPIRKHSTIRVLDNAGKLLEKPFLRGYTYYINTGSNNKINFTFGGTSAKAAQGGYQLKISECDPSQGNNGWLDNNAHWSNIIDEE